MGQAKIRLSQTEMEIACSTELILTKNAVLQKVKLLLADLQQEQQLTLAKFADALPDDLLRSSPKISRGENYRGLPYYMLDQPRVFDQENIAAIRTMFWWGNFFSTTLHVSGKYKNAAGEKIVAAFPSLQEQGFFICVNEDQWEHHFETDNYIPLSTIDGGELRQLITKSSFIKLANKLPVQQWEEAPATLLAFFDQFLTIIVD
jgi:hypothetical protein